MGEGRFNPRDGTQRAKLAAVLKIDLRELQRIAGKAPDQDASSVRIVDAMSDLPALLTKLLREAKHTLKDIRLSAPYTLPPHVQTEFRKAISARILAKTIEVQHVEIFYTLDRLKEVLSNILRYDGCPYYVRSYCPGLKEVAPALGGYAFDDVNVILGGYFTTIPPHDRPGVHLQGPDVRTLFSRYWDEIWRRGTPLSLGGASDLGQVRMLAITMGLRPSEWESFLHEAKALRSADQAALRI